MGHDREDRRRGSRADDERLVCFGREVRRGCSRADQPGRQSQALAVFSVVWPYTSYTVIILHGIRFSRT